MSLKLLQEGGIRFTDVQEVRSVMPEWPHTLGEVQWGEEDQKNGVQTKTSSEDSRKCL